MADLRVDATSVAQLKKDISRQFFTDNRTEIRRVIQQEAPVDLGGLRGGIDTQLVETATETYLRVTSSADYTTPVALGHGEIRPKDPNGVLVFMSRLTGEKVFTKKVRAMAGNEFFARAFKKMGFRYTESSNLRR